VPENQQENKGLERVTRFRGGLPQTSEASAGWLTSRVIAVSHGKKIRRGRRTLTGDKTAANNAASAITHRRAQARMGSISELEGLARHLRARGSIVARGAVSKG